MLSYAYQNLMQLNYNEVETEDFDNVQDLFASILSKGISFQLKQGLIREYIEKEEVLSTLRGKIDITESIKEKVQKSHKLFCVYDELSENHCMNQILKTTSFLLIYSDQVKPINKAALKRTMLYFSNVDLIDPSIIRWDMLRYHRNNQTYRMLMNICYLVLDQLILTTDKGKHKLASFLDSQAMSRLYEKFILEYYKRNHPGLHPSSAQIQWNVDDDIRDFLPKMQTDITLTHNKNVLIIDAKYYQNSMQKIEEYNSYSNHSSNMYQIFAYVKNRDINGTGNVSGLLLYAKTDEDITPDNDYMMGGNKISVRTLDLGCSFKLISQTLDKIADALQCKN